MDLNEICRVVVCCLHVELKKTTITLIIKQAAKAKALLLVIEVTQSLLSHSGKAKYKGGMGNM